MTDTHLQYLQQWIGRRESRAELLAPAAAGLLAATLDAPDLPMQHGETLPPAFHWLYFPPICRQAELGPDGHPPRGELLPPIELPRRMWAASRIDFVRPLTIGQTARRVSEIADVVLKQGRTGPLAFVKLRHLISDDCGRVAIEELQEIVYRDRPQPGQAAPPPVAAPADPAWCAEVRPDPVLLFRYSALTFNAHRIHYDRDYAVGVEGYPALVVQGPLIATLLLDRLRRELPQARLRRFEFRAVRPAYVDATLHLCGRPQADGETVRLWCRDSSGALCMDAHAVIE